MNFSFNKITKKKPAKKQPPPKVELTEEDIMEDNPDLLAAVAVDPEKLRLKRENEITRKKSDDLNETYFYTCIVWQSEEQKLEFLAQIPDVLAVDDVFIDGETFAAAVGKPVTPGIMPPVDLPLNKKLADLAKIPKNL